MRMIGGRMISNLRYAGDTTITSNTLRELEWLLRRVKHVSAKDGLHLNVTKTKIMTAAGVNPHIILDGEVVAAVNSFVFLGASVSGVGSCSAEVRR